MPLESYALDTLENVKAYLGVDDADRDDKITDLINEVSRKILRETQCEFKPLLAGATRTVEYACGSNAIELTPYQAQTVTAITINPGTDESVLAAGDWQLRPITNPDGVYSAIVLKSYYAGGYFHKVPVTVTGTWGWPEVPADVLGWHKEMVEDRFLANVAYYADADGQIAPPAPVTVPFRIREEMQDYRPTYVGTV